jgi:ATP-dependent Lhr-like helicase
VAEGLPGGFGPLYRVLRSMEEAGRVRRGYFVEGLSGAQFALPGAVDRLRALRPDPDAIAPARPAEVRVLAAVDPANPYGALVPWPAPEAGCETRPRRVAGARVVLARGDLIVYATPDGRHLLTFGVAEADAATLQLAFSAVAALPRSGRRRPATVEQVDGVPVTQSRHRALLLAAGFEPDYRGLRPALRQGLDGATLDGVEVAGAPRPGPPRTPPARAC